jgi:hypothetical protein
MSILLTITSMLIAASGLVFILWGRNSLTRALGLIMLVHFMLVIVLVLSEIKFQ